MIRFQVIPLISMICYIKRRGKYEEIDRIVLKLYRVRVKVSYCMVILLIEEEKIVTQEFEFF